MSDSLDLIYDALDVFSGKKRFLAEEPNKPDERAEFNECDQHEGAKNE